MRMNQGERRASSHLAKDTLRATKGGQKGAPGKERTGGGERAEPPGEVSWVLVHGELRRGDGFHREDGFSERGMRKGEAKGAEGREV